MIVDRRRWMVGAGSLVGLAAGAAAGQAGAKKLYRVAEPKAMLEAMRGVMAEDRIGTLITVDGEGQPRARSVLVSAPDDALMLWMGTRKGSRKVEQIRAQPRVTVHFAVDAKEEYVSLMGEARVHTDTAMIAEKNPFTGKARAEYFPHYPEDFMLIGFRPKWLEVLTSAVPPNGETWQPQGLELEG